MFKKIKRENSADINPIVPILEEKIGKNSLGEIEIAAAILGLAVVLIQADMEFHEKERESFLDLIEKECRVPRDLAEEIAEEILEISEVDLETAYLGTLLAESTDEERREDILMSLFSIARSDSVYDPYEDKYLKVISRHLLMDHNEFIAAKLKSKEE
ncbi:TerB family tellurite resistance protein [Spirochaetota bacterium]